MDACTVAALDAITAFAVPNLGGHLATPSIFSGLAVPRVASLTDRFGLLQVGSVFVAALFAVDEVNPNTGRSKVNARGVCTREIIACDIRPHIKP